MQLLIRVSLSMFLVAFAMVGAGCPASSSSANASVPDASVADSPEQVVMEVARGLSEGRPYAVWDALPGSYQNDVTELVHSFAASLDAEIWNQCFTIVRKTGNMLKSQKEVILAMPKIRNSNGFDAEKLSREWDFVVAPFMTIAKSDLANVESMRKLDVRQCLGTTGVALMQDLVKLSDLAPERSSNNLASLALTKATLVSREGDSAMVEIQQPDRPTVTEAFVRVEGKWIPKSLADDWEQEMTKARAQFAQMSDERMQKAKPQIMSILTGIEGTVDQLAAAETPEQFEQNMQAGMFQIFGGVMGIAQAMESSAE